MPDALHTETFHVRSYEIDPQGVASTQTVCNYLQEAAGNHAHALGFSIEHLGAQGFTWVLARLHVQIDRYPRWRDRLTVTTWPSGHNGLFATRDFLVHDGQGSLIARATSAWLMIDLERRRPTRIPATFDVYENPGRPRALADPAERLPAPEGTPEAHRFRVRYSDLDLNGHVNNVRYVEWAVEAVEAERLQQAEVAALEVHFRAETGYGDVVTVHTAPAAGDAVLLHRLVGEAGREVARARTRWRRTG